MIKEILIAGLLGSVASTNNHLTTHYQNNTQYQQLECGTICKENNIQGTHIAYIHLHCGNACEKNNAKDTRTSYTQYDYRDALEPMEEFLDKYQPMVLDMLNKSSDNKMITSNYYEFLVDTLRHETFEGLHKNPAHMELEYVSFTITQDGLLTFEKPFRIK